jgi:hypothetical protein
MTYSTTISCPDSPTPTVSPSYKKSPMLRFLGSPELSVPSKTSPEEY